MVLGRAMRRLRGSSPVFGIVSAAFEVVLCCFEEGGCDGRSVVRISFGHFEGNWLVPGQLVVG